MIDSLIFDLCAAAEWLFWSILKFAAVATLLLAPFALEWVMDGCPSQDEQVEMLVDDVKGGWK